MANTGGRKTFKRNTRVKYLTIDGRISDDIYLIGANSDVVEFIRSDRKGHIILRHENNNKELKVHFRRILLLEIEGKVPVIEFDDKYKVICQKCGRVEDISPCDNNFNCSICGTFPLHWLGAKPMVDAVKDIEPIVVKKTISKPKTTKRAPKPTPIKVDFDALKGLTNCELWTKKNVKFDHTNVDVQAHALLFTDSNPRKLCFNTYDGVLGKKSPPLSTSEFVEDTEVKNTKRPKPWFFIKDLSKVKAKLSKDGYEQQ